MRQPTPDPITAPPADVSNWNLANGLTAFRLCCVPVFGWLLLGHDGHQASWRIAAWVVFAIASATDRLDGEVARSRGLVTTLGKIADPIADKALMGTALIGLSALGDLAWWVTSVILFREVAVTLLRFAVLRHGVIPASRGGKVKTLLQGLAITGYVLPLAGAWHLVARTVMGVALVVTVGTGVDYVARARRLRRGTTG